jgi:hypothetical protein
MNANVLELAKPKPVKVKSHARKSRTKSDAVKAIKQTFTPARVFVFAVTLFALAVSLTHLSEGVVLIADCPTWQGWAIAIAIDAMLIANEYALLVATNRAEIAQPAHALMGLCAVWSMYLNAMGFTHGHIDLTQADGIGLGVFLPLAIALATFVGARVK